MHPGKGDGIQLAPNDGLLHALANLVTRAVTQVYWYVDFTAKAACWPVEPDDKITINGGDDLAILRCVMRIPGHSRLMTPLLGLGVVWFVLVTSITHTGPRQVTDKLGPGVTNRSFMRRGTGDLRSTLLVSE